MKPYRIFFAVLILLLVGCVSTGDIANNIRNTLTHRSDNFGPAPENYQKIIRDNFSKHASVHHPEHFDIKVHHPIKFYRLNHTGDQVEWFAWVSEVAVPEKAIYKFFSNDSKEWKTYYVRFSGNSIAEIYGGQDYVYLKSGNSYELAEHNGEKGYYRVLNRGAIVKDLSTTTMTAFRNESVTEKQLPGATITPKPKSTIKDTHSTAGSAKQAKLTEKHQTNVASKAVKPVESAEDKKLNAAIALWREERIRYSNRLTSELNALNNQWAVKCDTITQNFFRSANTSGSGTKVCHQCSGCESDWSWAVDKLESKHWKAKKLWGEEHPKPTKESIAKAEKEQELQKSKNRTAVSSKTANVKVWEYNGKSATVISQGIPTEALGEYKIGGGSRSGTFSLFEGGKGQCISCQGIGKVFEGNTNFEWAVLYQDGEIFKQPGKGMGSSIESIGDRYILIMKFNDGSYHWNYWQARSNTYYSPPMDFYTVGTYATKNMPKVKGF